MKKRYLTIEYPLYEQLCECCELATRERPIYLFPHTETPATKSNLNELEQLGLITKHRVNSGLSEITKAVPSKLALEFFNARQIFPIFPETAGWLFTIKKHALHPMGQASMFLVGVNACTYEDALNILNERKLREQNDLPELWQKHELKNLRASILPFPAEMITF